MAGGRLSRQHRRLHRLRPRPEPAQGRAKAEGVESRPQGRDLLAALRDGTRALLVAPPGAGKTTRVAPALLAEPWCEGQVLLLVPRRLAARAAAEYIARERGEQAGATIGYATRLDSKVGKATRVIAMTHGVFLARLQADPELPASPPCCSTRSTSAASTATSALALALDAAAALRPDLRIVAMSATLDGERFGRLLGDPPRIESEGKSYPLTLIHEGRDADPADRAANGRRDPRALARA
jgi:ATP-dependent helicase HrpB